MSKKKIAAGVAACALVIALFYGYKLPVYYGMKGAEDSLHHYLDNIREKKGYSLSKRISYYLFTDKLKDSGRALNFENVEECGDICFDLAKKGYVNVFYSMKNNKNGVRQYYRQLISEGGEIEEEVIAGNVYFEKFSSMDCEFFETDNHLINYFNFKNKYSVCFEHGHFVEAYVHLDTTKSFFGGLPHFELGTKFDLSAKLSWFDAVNDLGK
jgi:hypothetical protein